MLPDCGQVYFIDLDREAEIDIGTTWSTDLGPAECILSEDWQDYKVTVGQRVAYPANYVNLFNTVANMYNHNERDRQNYKIVPDDVFFWNEPTFVECTVKEFISTNSAGKFAPFKHLVVLNDIGNYLPRLWNET